MDTSSDASLKRKREAEPYKSQKKFNSGFNKNSGEQKQVFTKEERQALKKERKRLKPNADVIEEANQIWSLSIGRLSAAERNGHLDKMLDSLRGKIKEVAVKHDASRGLQLLIKYGNKEHRAEVFAELTGHFVSLSQNHYGHFLVLKFMSFGTLAMKKTIMKELVGSIKKLSTKADAAKVVDYVFATMRQEADRNLMLIEFYGKEFYVQSQIDGGVAPSLDELMAEQPDAKKQSILINLRDYITKMISKSMLMFRYVHPLILGYLKHSNKERSLALITEIAPFTLAFHDSLDGALVICHMLAHGTPKIRKIIVKLLKGRVVEFCTHDTAFLFVLRALSIVDDTVLLQKNILADLTTEAGHLHPDLFTSQKGSKILFQLLAPGKNTYLYKDELKQVALVTTVDEEGNTVSTSRKDPAQRSTELLKNLLGPILDMFLNPKNMLYVSPDQIKMTSFSAMNPDAEDGDSKMQDEDEEAEEKPTLSNEALRVAEKKRRDDATISTLRGLACDNVASKILFETIVASTTRAEEKTFAHVNISDRLSALLENVLNLCTKDQQYGPQHVLENNFCHKLFKRLVIELKHTDFSERLFKILTPQLEQLAVVNRGAFILVAILENTSNMEPYLTQLKPFRKSIQNASNTGCTILSKVMKGASSSTSSESSAGKLKEEKTKVKKDKKKKKSKKE